MNIDILNSIHGGEVSSINNYIFIKNKSSIRKIDSKTCFILDLCKTMYIVMTKYCIFSESNHSQRTDPINIGARKMNSYKQPFERIHF